MKNTRIIITVLALLVAGYVHSENAQTVLAQADQLHRNLTRGVPLLPQHANYKRIIMAVANNSWEDAAGYITDPQNGSPSFYRNTIGRLAASINETHALDQPPNDLWAMMVGYAANDLPIGEMLYENRVFYLFNPGSGIPRYGDRPEEHVRNAWLRVNPAVAFEERPFPNIVGVGAFTTSQFGKFFDAGTRRAVFKATLNHFFCLDQLELGTTELPDAYVRRDVPRGSDYLSNCILCHAMMDGVKWAFSGFDYQVDDDNGFVVMEEKRDRVNENNFPYAYNPEDQDYWYWNFTATQNELLGLNPIAEVELVRRNNYAQIEGSGLESFARLVAASDGFFKCMAKRIITALVLKKDWSLAFLSDHDKEELKKLNKQIRTVAGTLRETQNLRKTYEAAAISYTKGEL